jgi:hypothetical protein
VTALWIGGGLLAAALLLVVGAALAEQLGRRWGIRQGRRDYLAEERRTNQGPPPGVPDRRRRDVGPGGRHRRDDTTPGQTTATGIIRAVRKINPDDLPPIPRATRAQLRDSDGHR